MAWVGDNITEMEKSGVLLHQKSGCSGDRENSESIVCGPAGTGCTVQCSGTCPVSVSLNSSGFLAVQAVEAAPHKFLRTHSARVLRSYEWEDLVYTGVNALHPPCLEYYRHKDV